MSDPGTRRSEAAYAKGSPFKPAEQEPLLNRAIPVVARAKSTLKERLDDAGLTGEIGEERFHPTVRAAVEACS